MSYKYSDKRRSRTGKHGVASHPDLMRGETSSSEFIYSVVLERASILREQDLERQQDEEAQVALTEKKLAATCTTNTNTDSDEVRPFDQDGDAGHEELPQCQPPTLQRGGHVTPPAPAREPGAYSARGNALQRTQEFHVSMLDTSSVYTAPSLLNSRRSVTVSAAETISGHSLTNHSQEQQQQQQQEKTSHTTKCTKAVLGLTLGLLLALAIILVLLVFLLKTNHKQDSGATQPFTATTATPVTIPPSFDNANYVLSLLPPETIEAINIFHSPQAQAFDWIVQDTTYLQHLSPERVRQRFALVTFFFAMNGISWKIRTNWLDYELHECTWYQSQINQQSILAQAQFNRCDAPQSESVEYEYQYTDVLQQPGNLQYIYFYDNNLFGTLPPEFFWLTSLQYIHFGKNTLQGTLPPQIQFLTNLKTLSLSHHDLSGTIPSQIGSLTSLTQWLMNGNRFTGQLPSEIGLLQNVQQISLELNSFTGTIPTQLGTCTKLRELEIYETQISGPIPTELGAIDMVLWHLDIENNHLTGTVPTELVSNANLAHLLLRGNPLTGVIPSELCALNQTLFDCTSSLCGCDCPC